MTNEIIILRGSWGDLSVHRPTGHIVAYDDNGKDGWEPGDIGYHDILFILPETLLQGRCGCLDKHGETDILNAGFVDDAGRVTLPLSFDEDEEMHIDPVALLPSPGRTSGPSYGQLPIK